MVGSGTIFRERAKECECVAEEIRIYLVFVFDYDKRILSLRAVDRTRERAELHLDVVKREAKELHIRHKAWVEPQITDHAFAASMYEFKGSQ